jgi:hypothetical protein
MAALKAESLAGSWTATIRATRPSRSPNSNGNDPGQTNESGHARKPIGQRVALYQAAERSTIRDYGLVPAISRQFRHTGDAGSVSFFGRPVSEIGGEISVDFHADADFADFRTFPGHDRSSCSRFSGNAGAPAVRSLCRPVGVCPGASWWGQHGEALRTVLRSFCAALCLVAAEGCAGSIHSASQGTMPSTGIGRAIK